MEDNLIAINVVIADRNYRLKIEPDEEELVRKTVKIVNERIQEYKRDFAGKDMQDYVSMVLIWFATEQNRNGMELIKLKETSERLQSLENMIDRVAEQMENK
jgi:cell division protein ZapA (FtsZ GTPase activity inhibitor)